MIIGDDIVINCPETGFALRLAKSCLKCDYYGGIQAAEVNKEKIEVKDIDNCVVICKRPITRRLMSVIE